MFIPKQTGTANDRMQTETISDVYYEKFLNIFRQRQTEMITD